MLLRKLFVAILLSLSSPLWASTLRSDGSTLLLKSIVENMGEGRLRAIVIDKNRLESRVFLNESDAVEIKRGMWVLKAGEYQEEI